MAILVYYCHTLFVEDGVTFFFAEAIHESPNVEETWVVHRVRIIFSCCCCSRINSHNQVRGHRTGSSPSGGGKYPKEKIKPAITQNHGWSFYKGVCERYLVPTVAWVGI